MSESKRTVRVQFDIPKEKWEMLEKLVQTSGVNTKKDLINNALSLLEWAINERRAGRIIVSVDEKEQKYKELYMPILSSIAGE